MSKSIALLGLLFLAMGECATGGGRDGHWSEGMYFPPEAARVQGSQARREAPYPGGNLPPDPWTGESRAQSQPYAPPAEALGYPREDYSPYQRPEPQAGRYDYLEDRPGAYPPLEGGYSAPARPRYVEPGYAEGGVRYGSGIAQYAPGPALPGQTYSPEPYPSMGGTLGGGLYPPILAPATPYLGLGQAAPYASPTTPGVAPSPYLNQFGLGASSLLGLLPLSATGLPFW